MDNGLFAFNTLIWLVLLYRYITKRQPSEFHPAGAYIAFHGILFTVLPIVNTFVESNLIVQFSNFAAGEGARIILMLGSLSLAIAFSWAREHGYNLSHDQWVYIMLFGIASLWVLVAGFVIPAAFSALLESAHTKRYWP